MSIIRVILGAAGVGVIAFIGALAHELGEWCKDCCPYWQDESDESNHE